MTGQEVKEIRKKLGMDRQEFGELLSSSERTVQNWEIGVRNIPDAKIELLNTHLRAANKPFFSETIIHSFDWPRFLEFTKLTQADLADRLDVKQPYISQLKREFEKGRPVPDGMLDKLRDVFQDIDIDAFIRTNKVKAKKDGTVIDMYTSMRPYYDIDFMGTPGAELLDPAVKIEPDNYISVPHFTDVDFYTRVTGDSMYPKFRHGDIIACKSIDTKGFFAFYEAYAIVTRTNNQRLIKYIHPHPSDPDKLLLVSYDSQKYPPQPIEREEVLKLFQIKGKIEL